MGPQAQLRATLEVTQQQATQAQKQLQELQQRSSQIQPRALAVLSSSCAHPELSLHPDLRDL